MSSACTPVLVGVASSVVEIKLAYSPLKWKNFIDRNQLKKYMHVGIDVRCMYTYFGGHGLFSCGDSVTLNLTKFLFHLILY